MGISQPCLTPQGGHISDLSHPFPHLPRLGLTYRGVYSKHPAAGVRVVEPWNLRNASKCWLFKSPRHETAMIMGNTMTKQMGVDWKNRLFHSQINPNEGFSSSKGLGRLIGLCLLHFLEVHLRVGPNTMSFSANKPQLFTLNAVNSMLLFGWRFVRPTEKTTIWLWLT